MLAEASTRNRMCLAAHLETSQVLTISLADKSAGCLSLPLQATLLAPEDDRLPLCWTSIHSEGRSAEPVYLLVLSFISANSDVCFSIDAVDLARKAFGVDDLRFDFVSRDRLRYAMHYLPAVSGVLAARLQCLNVGWTAQNVVPLRG